MAKKRKTPRPSKKNLPQNAEWLDDRLSSIMIDLDALESMPIKDVKAELKKIAPNQPNLAKEINERLPEGVSIPLSSAPAHRTRKKSTSSKASDRSAKPATARRSAKSPFRWRSIRGAMVLSALIILAAILIPRGIRSMREVPVDPATAIQGSENEQNTPPTWLEGPSAGEHVRGVRFTLEGLDRVAVFTPLPANADTVETSISLRISVDAAGNVTRLVPLSQSPDELEPTVIKELLNWRFRPNASSDTTSHTGTITVEFYRW